MGIAVMVPVVCAATLGLVVSVRRVFPRGDSEQR